MTILLSQVNHGRAVVLLTANATMNVATSNSTPSDLANAADTLPVNGASITQLFWTTTTTIKIARGSTQFLVLNGNGHWNLQGNGISLNQLLASTFVATFGDANSSLIVEFSKV
jgi:hypothetical protein